MTAAKLQANQINAQFSTGPRTPEGKAISSRNALRYGIYSTIRLLPGEDEAELDALTQSMLADHNPLNGSEAELVNHLIDLQWRLRRVSARETELLEATEFDHRALNNLSLHGARLRRQFSKLLQDFRGVHAERSERVKEQIRLADVVYKADQIEGRAESTIPNVGFDFTLDFFYDWKRRDLAFQERKAVVVAAEKERTAGQNAPAPPLQQAA